jgi:hypothetical protein
MKKLLLLLLLPLFSLSQECVKIDTVYVSAKVREFKTKDILFGIKQIAEEELSNKFCLSEKGAPIMVEVYYFGIPKSTFRIAGIEKSNTTTQVGVRLFYNGVKYEGVGESDVEVRAIMLEVQEGSIPFSKTTLSSALKKAITAAVFGL